MSSGHRYAHTIFLSLSLLIAMVSFSWGSLPETPQGSTTYTCSTTLAPELGNDPPIVIDFLLPDPNGIYTVTTDVTNSVLTFSLTISGGNPLPSNTDIAYLEVGEPSSANAVTYLVKSSGGSLVIMIDEF